MVYLVVSVFLIYICIYIVYFFRSYFFIKGSAVRSVKKRYQLTVEKFHGLSTEREGESRSGEKSFNGKGGVV